MSGSSKPTLEESAREFRRGAARGDEPLHTYSRKVTENSGSVYINVPKRVVEAWGIEQGDEISFDEFVDKAEVRPK